MQIRPGQASIWSQLNEWGFVERRIQIERPLHGIFFTITPEFSNHFIIISYPRIGEAPPLQSLSIVENMRSSVDQPKVEIQLEEEQLKSLLNQKNITSFEQFSSSSAFIGASIVVKAPAKAKAKTIVYQTHMMIPIFEGDEYPRCHWFICEIIWAANDIDNEEKKIHQFVAGLRKRALTWFMNYTNNQVHTKGQIKNEFLAFFKTKEGSHLAAQKLKDIKQKHGESIRAYDRRLEYTLSLIPYAIEERLLIQWFIAGLLP